MALRRERLSSMLNFFRTTPTVTITFSENAEVHEMVNSLHGPTDLPFFSGTEPVRGSLSLTIPRGKTITHREVSLELFGEFRTASGVRLHRFLERIQHLLPAGDLTSSFTSDFNFDNLNLPTSTYYGGCVNAGYAVALRITYFVSDFVHEVPFGVIVMQRPPRPIPVHREVGITNLLHVEFVFPKRHFGSHDVVVGAVYFTLVKLRIVYMTMMFYRVEEYRADLTVLQSKEILRTYDLMDGAPVRGEMIPIRIYMGDLNFWPYLDFNGSALKVEHYLRVKMIDENGAHYCKRMMVQFGRYRKDARLSE
jgi:vacuolar protein sorting-associated protein 26